MGHVECFGNTKVTRRRRTRYARRQRGRPKEDALGKEGPTTEQRGGARAPRGAPLEARAKREEEGSREHSGAGQSAACTHTGNDPVGS